MAVELDFKRQVNNNIKFHSAPYIKHFFFFFFFGRLGLLLAHPLSWCSGNTLIKKNRKKKVMPVLHSLKILNKLLNISVKYVCARWRCGAFALLNCVARCAFYKRIWAFYKDAYFSRVTWQHWVSGLTSQHQLPELCFKHAAGQNGTCLFIRIGFFIRRYSHFLVSF